MSDDSATTGFPSAVGADGGIPFPATVTGANDGVWHWEYGTGIMAKSVSTYAADDHQGIHGLQMSFRNGWSSPMYGTSCDGTYTTLELKDDETITRCVLWQNSEQNRLGRIRLETSAGQTYDVGQQDPGTTPNEWNVGSGWLIGCYGACGSDVDNAGFVFLNTIESMQITNFTFNNGNGINAFSNIDKVSLNTQTYQNESTTGTTTWTMSESVTKATGWSTTSSTATTLGVSMSVSAEIPELASASVSADFSMTNTQSSTTDVQNSVDLSFTETGTLAPGQSIEVSAWSYEGVVTDLPYTSNVTANVNGFIWNFTDSGTFQSTSYSNTFITVKDLTSGETSTKLASQ